MLIVGNVCLLAFPPSATRQFRLELGFATRFHIFVLRAFTTGSSGPSTVGGGNELKFLLRRSGDTFHGSLHIVRGGVSLGTVETCSPQDVREEWTVRFLISSCRWWCYFCLDCRLGECRLSKKVLVCNVLKNPVWCDLHVEFLVGLKRTWDQKLSSGLLLTFMATQLFQFRFADAEQYWLITWTFCTSQRIIRPVFSQHHEERH